jgi:hypothetical protein
MEKETENLIRKIIGALVNMVLLPGLGQVICGRIKKGLVLIALCLSIIALFVFMILGVGILQPERGIGIIMLIFITIILGLFVIWVYALVDVIIGEVEPLGGGKENE